MFMTEKPEPYIILVGPIAPPIGGVTQWTSLVARELQEQHVTHALVNTSPKRRRLDGQSKRERIAGGLQTTLSTVRKLIQASRPTRPSAIHISTSGSIAHVRDIIVALLGKAMRARVMLHLHHGRLPKILQRRSFERTAMDILALLLDTLIVLDKNSAAAAARRWKNISVEVIANPVEMQQPGPSDTTSSGKNVLYLGWVIPNKGVEDLLAVWTDLSAAYPDWHLTLVGGVSDSYRNELAEKYKSERWEITGEVTHSQAMQTLAAAEILVLPSYSEGFPNVILEAMSLGKAVVATTVGGIPEMLNQGGGILITPRAHHELETALSKLMADDAYRTETGRQGYDRVAREYDVSLVVNTYRQLWEGIRVEN